MTQLSDRVGIARSDTVVRRQQAMIAAGNGLGLAVAAVLTLWGIVSDDPWLIAAGIGWGQVVVLATFVQASNDQSPLMNPLALIAVTLFVGAALRPLYMRSRSSAERTEFLAGLPDDVILDGVLLSTLLIGCTTFAYLLSTAYQSSRAASGFRTSRALGLESTSSVKLVHLAAVGVGISTIGVVLYFRSQGIGVSSLLTRLSAKRRVEIDGRFGSSGNYLWLASIAMFVGLIALWSRRTTAQFRKQRWSITIAVCLGLGLVIPIVGSSRNEILLLGLYILCISTDFGARLRRRQVLGAGIGLLLVVVVLGGLRTSGSNSVEGVIAFATESSIESVLGTHNWAGVEKTAIIANRVPERMEFQNGRTLALAAVAPVPRAIWPGKPNVRIGPEIGERLFNLDRNGRTGAPPGLAGELYLNAGVGGIVAGGLAFGAVLAFARRRFDRLAPDSLQRVAWMVVIANLALKLPGSDFSGVLVKMGLSFVILKLMIRFVSRPAQQASTVAITP